MGPLFLALTVQMPSLAAVAAYLVLGRLLIIGEEAFMLHVLAAGGSVSFFIAEGTGSGERFVATLVALEVFGMLGASNSLTGIPM